MAVARTGRGRQNGKIKAFTMRVFCLLVLLIVAAAVIVFANQNSEEVTLKYLDRSVSCPMSVLVALVYVLGMVSGWTIVGILKSSFRRVTQLPQD
jgi:uncharacterized membrane protein YciS (DUF1049 family)